MYVYNTCTLLFTMKHVDAILDASDNVISEQAKVKNWNEPKQVKSKSQDLSRSLEIKSN